ncbi:hypothetical protein O7635_10660 [Asanoa sp. WMMD1127]|uniref:hypothetical protein n=1 Tax=Asanoa sp. WMMD1127 TaxID=3016107 RepID=UPI0024164D25|nr:hypothetical protein [Asanoa sp. WMMD1127]MDG4822312.1 hypothetical protein [Asanoa sp. WMMD1127]
MLRRLIRRLVAVGGAAGAALALTTAPAIAAPEIVSLSMRDITLADGHPGMVASATLISAQPVVLDDVVVTYDFGAVADLVEVVAPAGADCSLVDKTVLACHRDQVRLGSAPLVGQFDVLVRAVDGAALGEGPLQLGVEAAGLPFVSAGSWVRVGAGVDLVAGPSTALTRRPGESFTLPLKVDVAGTVAVERPSVYFTETYAFRATRKFTNCLYVLDHIRNCWFDGTFTPGAAYTAVLPFLLGADTAAPGTKGLEATWFTAAEAADYESFLAGHGYSGGEPGTEGELTLTGELELLADQADTVPHNNRTGLSVTVAGHNGIDLAALGAAVRGAVGERRPVTVGVRNLGPAAAEQPGGDVATVEVTIPPGTTATAVPPECAPPGDPVAAGVPGAAAYHCKPGALLYPDTSLEFSFELRIDRARPADGAIRLTGAGTGGAGNDRAAITVNDPATGTDTAPPVAGGRLPITGAPASALLGLGALLILGGLTAVVLARTRAG